MTIITRKEAKDKGLKTYFTGKLCSRGHTSKRRVDNATCQTCAIIKSREVESKNPERWKQYQQTYRKQHKDRVRALNRKWAQRNPGKVRASCVKRLAHVKQATPPWADYSTISKIYEDCSIKTQTTGIPHQVDHIIPLRGALVCGLHVQNNLQIITATENLAKWNTHEG